MAENPIETSAAAQSLMLKCPNGHDNRAGQRFCGTCGEPVEADGAEVASETEPSAPVASQPADTASRHRSGRRPATSVLIVVPVLVIGLVILGIFGLTRPASQNAKHQAKQLSQQIAATSRSNDSINAISARLHDTAQRLVDLDTAEADAGSAIIDAMNAAADRWNAGDKSAFSSPDVTNAIEQFKQVLTEERTLVTTFQKDIKAGEEVR